MATTKTYIDSPTNPGVCNIEVDGSQITNKNTTVPVAYSIPVPFTKSTNVARVNRTQGLSGNSTQTHTDFLYCISDRVYKDADGRRETLTQLKAKGHTAFRSSHNPAEEKDYEPGQFWVRYDNDGMAELQKTYNLKPWNAQVDSLETFYNFMQNMIIFKGSEIRYIIANFEYADWDSDKWAIATRKTEPFFSHYDNQTRTLQSIYDQGGFDLLNAHLHAKRAQMDSLWVMLQKEKHPLAKVTNGDRIHFQHLHPNGEGLGGTPLFYNIGNYKTASYEQLMLTGGLIFEPVRGGNITFNEGQPNQKTYNFSGIVADYYDFLVHYNYYTSIYCKQADFQEYLTTNDPTKQTVDYMHSKFWFTRKMIYETAATDEIRRYFNEMHKARGGRDFNALRVFGMREHMYEANNTSVTDNNSSQTNPSGIDYNANNVPPFIRSIPFAAGSQKLYLHKELIWTRTIQERMLYDGIWLWWESDKTGSHAFDYTQGKEQYIHLRSQEEHQKAWDYVRQDEDIFGAGSTLTREGIPMRYRTNNGAWTSFLPSLSPVQAMYNRDSNNNSKPVPFVLRRSKPGKHYYAFFVGQEDTDVTDIEFQHNGVTYSVKLTGCMPQTRTIRTL